MSTKFVQMIPIGQIWPYPGGHMFYIGLYWENMKKISFNLNFMLDFIESAVRFIIKTVWWAI